MTDFCVFRRSLPSFHLVISLGICLYSFFHFYIYRYRGVNVRTWAESVETISSLHRITVTVISAMLRRDTLTLAALCAVAARDAARDPVQPIREPSIHYTPY